MLIKCEIVSGPEELGNRVQDVSGSEIDPVETACRFASYLDERLKDAGATDSSLDGTTRTLAITGYDGVVRRYQVSCHVSRHYHARRV